MSAWCAPWKLLRENARPLTYVNEDDTKTVITPNHLIFGADIHDNFSFVSSKTFVPVKRRINTILEHFRKRFSSTYFNELRQSHFYRKSQTADKRHLLVGDIVLVKDDTHLPRSRADSQSWTTRHRTRWKCPWSKTFYHHQDRKERYHSSTAFQNDTFRNSSWSPTISCNWSYTDSCSCSIHRCKSWYRRKLWVSSAN